MRLARNLLLALAAALAAPGPAMAHPPAIVSDAAERAAAEEIRLFRKTMADAIEAKDGARLREMIFAGFAHTHPTGATADRAAHIASLLAGEAAIETAPARDLVVRTPNDWVAIATGTSTLKSRADGKTALVRWLAVYTRTDWSWMLVASQATLSKESKR